MQTQCSWLLRAALAKDCTTWRQFKRIVSPLTKDVSYRAQVRVKGRSSESATFPNRKEAEAWAASIESAIREGRHFPHAAAKRMSFDALAEDYTKTKLPEFDETQRAARSAQASS